MLYRESVPPAALELLEIIMAKPALSGFYLAGGTALALQLGHRLSVDLDLFGKRPFETQEIIDELQVGATITILSQSINILVLNVGGVKVDFVNYRYPMISSYVEEGKLRLLSMQDIGAMKLSAIAGRGRKRDFYDLFFLLKHFSFHELINFYRSKFDDANEFAVMRSITYFDDADLDEEVVLIVSEETWSSVKMKLLIEVNKEISS